MKISFRAGILGAGLGSRLNTKAGAKPLAPLHDGTNLLELHLARFREVGVNDIVCALRAEQFTEGMRSQLPKSQALDYIFVNTESSLHTLAELIGKLDPSKGPVLFTMADTVMLPGDFQRFCAFCASLSTGENAVLLTSFVDDEKPLWATVDPQGMVTGFGSEPRSVVTSGMYFLSPAAMELALEETARGTHKMRNFLSKIAERKFPIKSFVVTKTIDVDHPSDLEKAAHFLKKSKSDQGISS